MSSNWTDQLSQQMEHHEVEAPAGLWEGIEHGLGAQKPARRVRMVWPWRAAAAAAAVAGVVVGVQLWQEGQGNSLALLESQPSAALPPSGGAALRAEGAAPLPRRDEQNTAAGAPVGAAGASSSTAGSVKGAAGSVKGAAGSSALEPTSLPPVVPGDASPGASPSPSAGSEQQAAQGTRALLAVHQEQSRAVRSKRRPVAARPSLQLMAMSSPSLLQASYDAAPPTFNENIYMTADSMALESPRRERNAAPARVQKVANESPSYTDHDFPVKFGATVRLPLSRRLALDVGLSYACLRSTLNFTTQSGERMFGVSQRVNYVGVPVALTGDLWTNDRWLIYASAGGEVAKSVKTTWRDSEGSDYSASARPWQCSVSAAVGLQLNLNRHFGLYVQPSLDYYFDNHSVVQTYYNEHPFTPGLHLGLRARL